MHKWWDIKYRCPDDIKREQSISGTGLLDVIQQAIALGIDLEDIIELKKDEK